MPWLYDTALRHPHPLLHLEHALYFVTGVLLWWPVVHSRLSSGAKAAYVFAAFALASPIGLVMALVPEPLYDFYVEGPGLWGLDPLADQQIAGVHDVADRNSRLLRRLRVVRRPLLRRAGRRDLRTNVTSMDSIRRRLRSLFGSRLGLREGPERPPDRGRSPHRRRAPGASQPSRGERGAPFGQRAPFRAKIAAANRPRTSGGASRGIALLGDGAERLDDRGSNCVPAQRRSSAAASAVDIAARYGRCETIASKASHTAMMLAPSGIAPPPSASG